jgi:dipeptidyl aminopeptidase/acylaminoacyl peptidase
MKRYLLVITILLLITACGGPTPPSATPPSSAPQATQPPATPASASPAPTGAFVPGTPPAAERLPAPLYLLELGQVVRIERDGATRKVLTDETSQLSGVPPIATFAVSPLGTLAYVVGDMESDRLTVTDANGDGASILYAEAGHELSDLLFTPDGETLLLRLLNNRESPDIPSGLYRIPVTGGQLELLRADDEVDDQANPSRTLSGYEPVAFSPAGDQLLVEVQSLFYEDCTLGVMPAAGGEVARVTLPDSEQVYCGEAAWAPDSSSILFLAGPREGNDAAPQLWRAASDGSAPAALLPTATFARAPIGLPGGAVRFLLATVERDASGVIVGARFEPAELGPQASAPTPLGAAVPEQIDDVLWAPDGNGAVVEVSSDELKSGLRWLRVGGEAMELPSAEDSVSDMAWGAE